MKHICPILSQFSGIKHGFFERNPDILTHNRKQAMEDMTGHPLPLITLKQVHGTEVLHVTETSKDKQEADGMVTKCPGIALGILTADCGPVLFCDPKAHVIGACHAGWKGAKAGILQNTIVAMEKIGAERSHIYATLGPTIWQEDYEVGPEFPDLICEAYETFFYPAEKKGHHHFNLPHYICLLLQREGIPHIHDLRLNTFSGNFSSRRKFLSQKIGQFRSDNLSAIAIT